jgi:hypothetical protein
MNPSIRTLLASFLIAAVAPVGLAALDLEQPAFAGNGNGGGNGGGHGGGNGGGNGGGHGGDHGNSGNAGGHAKSADADTGSHKNVDGDSESDGLAPNELGKLNGVMHASPTAIAHASTNSPIGTARAFGEALGDFLDSAETEDPSADEGDEAAEDDADDVSVDELGEMMARMTNKPVTAEQVQAVAEKVGIESEDEASDDEASDDQASEDPSEGESAPKLDQETAQAIADKANEIHGYADDTTGETASN